MKTDKFFYWRKIAKLKISNIDSSLICDGEEVKKGDERNGIFSFFFFFFGSNAD